MERESKWKSLDGLMWVQCIIVLTLLGISNLIPICIPGPVERHCLTQEHNTVFHAKAHICTTPRTTGEQINHGATTPPHILHRTVNKINLLTKDLHLKMHKRYHSLSCKYFDDIAKRKHTIMVC